MLPSSSPSSVRVFLSSRIAKLKGSTHPYKGEESEIIKSNRTMSSVMWISPECDALWTWPPRSSRPRIALLFYLLLFALTVFCVVADLDNCVCVCVCGFFFPLSLAFVLLLPPSPSPPHTHTPKITYGGTRIRSHERAHQGSALASFCFFVCLSSVASAPAALAAVVFASLDYAYEI